MGRPRCCCSLLSQFPRKVGSRNVRQPTRRSSTAAGLGSIDLLQLSLLRALPSSTPVVLCPAMNTHMYSHPFTAEHLLSLQQKLGYLISGPQGAGMLACGDEGEVILI
jgi:phosphopantothenoylcysteine synthetase/decarboxylase